MLLRRVQRIHLSTSSGEIDLDRSAYGIMCRLADEGPQRLGSLAQAFGLDPSTITRQVQALEQTALVIREPDPTDRRAALLRLSEEGLRVLEHTRQVRRDRMRVAMSDWTEGELEEFGRLLTKFNAAIDPMVTELDES